MPAFAPDFKVWAWPVDDLGATATLISILHGKITKDHEQIGKEFTFERPVAYSSVLDNYAGYTTELLQTGAWVLVETTTDNWSTSKTQFFGTIWEIDDPVENGEQLRAYTCRCLLSKARCTNVNYSRSTSVLVYEDEFDAADFDISDPNFLVNVPDNGEEYMPGGILYLAGYFVDGASERHTHDYGSDEYTYDAFNKKLYFNQQGGGIDTTGLSDKKTEGWTWIIHLLYYDQTDTQNSVNQVIEDTATADCWSFAGGLGFTAAQLDLDTIVSFDGVSPKLIRTVLFEKVDGPIQQLYDDMRDRGLIPLNYYLHHDPALADPATANLGMLKGEYLEQDNGAVVLPSNGVLRYRMPCTMEAVAGRVENWSESVNPRNLALNADITVNIPAGYSELGDKDNLKDTIHETFYQVYLDMTSGPNYPITPTAQDFIVFKLEPSDQTIPEFRRVQVRHTHPQETGGTGFIDIPVYQISRMPRVTISASRWRIAAEFATAVDVVTSDSIFTVLDASGMLEGDRIIIGVAGGDVAVVITDITGSQLTVTPAATGVANADTAVLNNPGIPIGPDAVNVRLDPTNVDDSGRDIDAAAEYITQAKYVAIRCHQDFFFRRDGNSVGSTARQSWYGFSEVRILTDERYRYTDGPDKGELPYAQITDRGTTITAVTDPQNFTVGSITGTEGDTWMAIGDTIQIQRAGTIHSVEVTNIVGLDITIDVAIAGLAINDKVGWRKRWMQDFIAAWHDLYYPKLYQKMRNSTNWLEPIQAENIGYVEEAEMACVERLLELIKVMHDHRCTISADHDIDIGVTMKVYSDTVPFMVTNMEIIFNPSPEESGADKPPTVVYDVGGSNFEETPE